MATSTKLIRVCKVSIVIGDLGSGLFHLGSLSLAIPRGWAQRVRAMKISAPLGKKRQVMRICKFQPCYQQALCMTREYILVPGLL